MVARCARKTTTLQVVLRTTAEWLSAATVICAFSAELGRTRFATSTQTASSAMNAPAVERTCGSIAGVLCLVFVRKDQYEILIKPQEDGQSLPSSNCNYTIPLLCIVVCKKTSKSAAYAVINSSEGGSRDAGTSGTIPAVNASRIASNSLRSASQRSNYLRRGIPTVKKRPVISQFHGGVAGTDRNAAD